LGKVLGNSNHTSGVCLVGKTEGVSGGTESWVNSPRIPLVQKSLFNGGPGRIGGGRPWQSLISSRHMPDASVEEIYLKQTAANKPLGKGKATKERVQSLRREERFSHQFVTYRTREGGAGEKEKTLTGVPGEIVGSKGGDPL